MDNKAKKATKQGNVSKEYKAPSRSKNPSKRAAKNAVSTVSNMMKMMNVPEIDALVSSFASPLDFPPVRVMSGWSSYKTALAQLFYRRNALFVDLQDGANFETYAFVFRDACRAFITPTEGSAPFTYYSGNYTLQVGVGQASLPIPPLTFLSGTNRPHGDILYPGQTGEDDRSYFWAQPGDQFKFDNNTGATVTIYAYQYKSGTITGASGAIAIASGASSNVTIVDTGYFGFTYQGSTFIAGGNFAVSLIGPGVAPPGKRVYYGHFALPDSQRNLASVDAVKIYASSLMYTNDAALINRQGKIAGCQIPRGREWLDFASYDAIASLNDSCSMSAENGMYGFLKPTQPEDFNFKDRDHLVAGASSPKSAFFLLTPDSDFLGVAMRISSTVAGDGYFTPAWALEYRTVDQWRDAKVANSRSDVVDVALGLLSRMPQWHENPFHFSDITDWIKEKTSDAYQFLKSALPSIVDAGTTAAKVAGAIIPLL